MHLPCCERAYQLRLFEVHQNDRLLDTRDRERLVVAVQDEYFAIKLGIGGTKFGIVINLLMKRGFIAIVGDEMALRGEQLLLMPMLRLTHRRGCAQSVRNRFFMFVRFEMRASFPVTVDDHPPMKD